MTAQATDHAHKCVLQKICGPELSISRPQPLARKAWYSICTQENPTECGRLGELGNNVLRLGLSATLYEEKLDVGDMKVRPSVL